MTAADLLAAVWDRPHDDLPRLAYADWLDEQGSPEEAARAEFIRVQCEAARLGRWGDGYPVLQSRQAWLWSKWARVWKGSLPDRLRKTGFHRGFPHPTTTVAAAQVAMLRPDAWDDAPLRAAGLTGGSAVAAALAHPVLRRVGRLELDVSPAGLAAALAALAGSPVLGNVLDLTLRGLGGSAAGLVDAVAGPHLPQLTALTVVHVHVAGGELAAVLAGRGRPLRTLALPQCGLTDYALTVLAESPRCDGLQELNLLGNEGVTAAGVAALAAAPRLGGVRMLELGGLPQVGDDGAIALASSPHVAGLRYLSLGGSGVGAAGALALARSPGLPRLGTLVLPGSVARSVGPAVAELRQRFGDGLHFH